MSLHSGDSSKGCAEYTVITPHRLCLLQCRPPYVNTVKRETKLPTMNKIIAAFGEVLWDLLPSGPVLGGAPMNFAFRVQGLGSRGLVISRLGRDERGLAAHNRIAALGMELQYLQWDETHPTGTVPVTLDEKNNPHYIILPDVAYDYIQTTSELRSLAAHVDCLCFGTLSQRAPQSRQTLYHLLDAAPNAIKLLDLNLRQDCYTPETIRTSLQRADILKLNETEAKELEAMLPVQAASPVEFCTKMMERYALSHCVITLGGEGVFAASADGEQVYEPGYSIPVADTLGAGDAFTAGFIHHLMAGQSLQDSCRAGNILGAIVAGQHGGTTPISHGDFATFLAGRHGRTRHSYFE